MATTDELQKREKSRRVWRLNKKEGIPVMEALDSVGISKDVYYRMKNEHEETWKNEITTAEELEDKLEELKRETRRFDDQLEQYREEAQEAKSMASDLEMEENWYSRVGDLCDKMISIEHLLRDEGVDVSLELQDELEDMREAVTSLDGRVSEIREESEEAREFLREFEKERDWYDTVEDIEDKMDRIEGLLQDEGLDISDINTSLGDLQDEVDSLDERLEALNGEISRLDDRIDEVEDEQSDLNARLIQVEQREIPESVFDLL